MKEITTKEQAEAFCDKYIELVDTIIRFDHNFRGEITPCCPRARECFIDNGLKKLANLLGLETFENPFRENITEISFNYKDVKFFELKKGEGNES